MNRKEKKLYDNMTEMIEHTHLIAKAIFADFEKNQASFIGDGPDLEDIPKWKQLKKKWLE